jgi:hypothetical protein
MFDKVDWIMNMWYDILIERFRDHLQTFHADIYIEEEVGFMMEHLHYENFRPGEEQISCCQCGCPWLIKFNIEFNVRLQE